MDFYRLTQALCVAIILLVVASIIALWNWFPIIGGVTLIGVVLAAITYGGLYAYENVRRIQHTYNKQADGGSRGDGRISHGDNGVLRLPERGVHRDEVQGRGEAQEGRRSGLPGDELTTFGDYLQANALRPQAEMLVGVGEDGVTVTTDKIRTMGIGGMPRTGKTVTTLNTILSQIIHRGGDIRYLVIDPHMYGQTGEELVTMMDSLFPFFLTLDEIRAGVHPGDTDYLEQLERMEHLSVGNPNEGGEELIEWIKLLKLEMDRRAHGKKASHWVVVIDEFTSVMRKPEVSKELGGILETLSEEAGKFDITLLIVGQVWKASRTGGTELRDTLPEFKAHRMRLNWAKLVVPDDVARKVPKLGTGWIAYYHDGQDDVLRVPYTTELDAKWVASKYARPINTTVRVVEEPPRALPRGRGKK